MINIDVLVIGAGTASNDAVKAAKRNANSVAIIEKGKI